VHAAISARDTYASNEHDRLRLITNAAGWHLTVGVVCLSWAPYCSYSRADRRWESIGILARLLTLVCEN